MGINTDSLTGTFLELVEAGNNNNVFSQTVVPVLTGTTAFGATLALATFVQLKALGISTGSPAPVPSLLGIGAVAVASIASHLGAVKGYEMAKYRSLPSIIPYGAYASPIDLRLNERNLSHAIRVCVVGLLSYKALGGRFWSVSPSSYTHLGSFARPMTSLPATSAYANKSERVLIEKLGRSIGCHTCGTRMIYSKAIQGAKFHADHMPPKSVVRQMNSRWYRKLFNVKVKQRFYPQCVDCSGRQGRILSGATLKSVLTVKRLPNLKRSGGGKNAHFHGLKMRKEHLAGGIVAGSTVYGADESDILGKRGGNRRRFKNWQGIVEKKCSNLLDAGKYF